LRGSFITNDANDANAAIDAHVDWGRSGPNHSDANPVRRIATRLLAGLECYSLKPEYLG
jgi:hypothetical protein